MKEELSMFYPSSCCPICVGDNIEIDGVAGVVEMVAAANSSDAKDLSCDETGGVLIRSNEFGRVLFPLTFPVTIKKLES